ncbi:hypothetical protein ACIQNG_20980 [Streptomyces sp. NPDC091377]|uniref:hypothetical protein n=1 Tax=Streptomyces sp. NPDC091377 TaxID=3365995 RepID=UPI00380A2DF7
MVAAVEVQDLVGVGEQQAAAIIGIDRGDEDVGTGDGQDVLHRGHGLVLLDADDEPGAEAALADSEPGLVGTVGGGGSVGEQEIIPIGSWEGVP